MTGSIKSSLYIALALLIYATLSSPFPQNPGVFEAAVALCLMLFVRIPIGALIAAGSFRGMDQYKSFPVWLHMLFFYLLWWELINGAVLQGNNLVDVIRDLIPFIYLFMPLFLLPAMQKAKLDWGAILPWIISLVGVIFSIRFYIKADINLTEIGRRYFSDYLLYFPYDPSVIFAGIFLPLMAIQIWRVKSPIRMIGSIVMVIGGALALGSLLAVAQRAPIGLAVVCFTVYALGVARQSIGKLVLVLVLFASVYMVAQDQIASSLDLLQAKQSEYGANGKTDEMFTIFKEVAKDPSAFFLGRGWGGLFFDPIYMAKVSYTHSVITYYMLKAGVIGLITFILYLGWVLSRMLKAFTMSRLPVILASIVPMSIGMLFQPSYKCLSYGVILALVCALPSRMKAMEHKPQEIDQVGRFVQISS
ncbi:hypothetical protein [Paenibacillus sedimenti]|uniref:O-antigen ligase family protein n=1 Tax=Paenibacillus sedimenti TaxID=2770274 RepID=A0A926KPA7_9BACL|nr:hypothetical protein [Paenibacillus sedimenti]MBD0379769.1 hypothetical protein [Paenibacillus sedimenti]